MQSGLNEFNLTSQKWIKATNAIGIISKPGRYGGGTFAHKDIAAGGSEKKVNSLEFEGIKKTHRK